MRDSCVGDRSLDGQQRHDGHAETDGDEPLRREVVVAAEDDVGLDANSLEGACGAQRAGVVAGHRDHPHAFELGEIDRVEFGQRMVGCGDEHLGIADQLDHRVRVDQRGNIGEGQVGLPAADQAFDVGDDGFVAQLDVDVRPAGAEEGERRWQQPGAGRLKGADPQHAGVAGGHRIEVGFRRSEPGNDVAGVIEQDLACLRQRHRARTARPIDQAMADGFLERGDLLRDRTLRVAEASGRLRERSGLGNGLQGHQVANFDADR